MLKRVLNIVQGLMTILIAGIVIFILMLAMAGSF